MTANVQNNRDNYGKYVCFSASCKGRAEPLSEILPYVHVHPGDITNNHLTATVNVPNNREKQKPILLCWRASAMGMPNLRGRCRNTFTICVLTQWGRRFWVCQRHAYIRVKYIKVRRRLVIRSTTLPRAKQ